MLKPRGLCGDLMQYGLEKLTAEYHPAVHCLSIETEAAVASQLVSRRLSSSVPFRDMSLVSKACLATTQIHVELRLSVAPERVP